MCNSETNEGGWMAPLGKGGGTLSLADARRKCHLLTVIREWEEIFILFLKCKRLQARSL